MESILNEQNGILISKALIEKLIYAYSSDGERWACLSSQRMGAQVVWRYSAIESAMAP